MYHLAISATLHRVPSILPTYRFTRIIICSNVKIYHEFYVVQSVRFCNILQLHILTNYINSIKGGFFELCIMHQVYQQLFRIYWVDFWTNLSSVPISFISNIAQWTFCIISNFTHILQVRFIKIFVTYMDNFYHKLE